FSAKIDQGREALADPTQLGRVLLARVFANDEFFRVSVIAGIDPDLVHPLGRFHRGFRFEMDIGDDWDIAAALAQTFRDIYQIARILHRGRGDADDLAANVRQFDRLLD